MTDEERKSELPPHDELERDEFGYVMNDFAWMWIQMMNEGRLPFPRPDGMVRVQGQDALMAMDAIRLLVAEVARLRAKADK